MENTSIHPFSVNRQILADVYDEFARKHYMTGLVEIDITHSRALIQQFFEKTGIKISFTGWIVRCIAEAVRKFPQVNSYRYGRRKTITFHDLHISVMVEKEIDGKKIPIPVSIRNAESKSSQQISQEIRNAQRESASESKQVLHQSKWMIFYPFIPKFIRKFIIRKIIANPFTYQKQGASIIVTSVGMFVKSSGWVLGFGGLTTLNIAIGGISKKVVRVDNGSEAREFLNLTINIDHDILDGGPAARFSQYLLQLIESGFDIPVSI
jgi:pyruvate/2-oxoglutarate dehydrogenase complex dihydrolipoamide acyltransferase (E2) component